jgi:ligand-binding SRPBCC domain-containing protein
MAEHLLKREQTIERPREVVFEFFSNAGNLQRITPPEVGFNIVTPQPIDVREGTLIDYTLSLRGIPVTWRTEINVWEPPFQFEDRQLRGPYAQWIHRHRFEELGPDRTLMFDEVRYRLPLEPLGDLFHFLVERELKHIFDYRQAAIAEIFDKKD